MAQSSLYTADQTNVVKVTLGSIVLSGDDHGVVWQVTSDVVRVFPIRQGMLGVPLSLATELALHLPASPVNWSIAHDRLLAWPKSLCHVVGEVDERCLLRILEARRQPSLSLGPALTGMTMPGTVRHSARFF